MTPRRLTLLLLALALVSIGCASSPATSAVPSDAGWGQPSTKPVLLPVLVSSAIATGPSRLLFLYLDSGNKVASAPDRTLKASFYDLDKDPTKPVVAADGKFMWTIEGERGMYAVNVALPAAGRWGAELTTEAPGSPAETTRLSFDVRESTSTVAVGQKAPASKTPTLADVGGDVAKISTDQHPDPDFYRTSVADAIAAHKPFVLIFATPKFCASAQCGPTLEHLKAIKAAHPEITFINVEPYQLKDVDGQLQPVMSADNAFQPTDVTNEWGLTSEPWIFAVDRDGTVRGSYEILMSDAELDAILPVLTAGA